MATKIFEETDPKVVDGTYDVYGYTPKERRLQLKRRQSAAEELYQACQGALKEFREWEGPEEEVLAGQYAGPARARNKAVRAYEAIRAAVKKADGR